MPNSIASTPLPLNEPVRDYAPGSEQRARIERATAELGSNQIEIPLIIGGREVRTGNTATAVCPHDHGHVLATYHKAGASEVQMAIDAANEAWHDWSEMPWEDRAAVFLRAAELLAGPWRDRINAATMLNQAKTVHQAEIDAACELIDFYRFNPAYARFIYEQQPESSPGVWNRVEYRALEGFVFAITPFNFTSIAGNLPTSPALMGNTCLWKPASSTVYSNYWIMKLLMAAGLPAGVINFIPGSGGQVGDPVLASPDFAGIHFTGSTPVFQGMWKTVGDNIAKYKCYPRIVGETGGKDFIFVHPSAADTDAVVTALVRGAFEFNGQKCSAASRAYIPISKWLLVKDMLMEQVGGLAQGSPLDFSNFVTAVIDENAFDSITAYIDHAASSTDHEIIVGGGYDKSKGYFIEPTVVVAKDPRSKLMEEEIFGPVLTLFVYDDEDLDETLEILDNTSPYALTGAIFADDRAAIVKMTTALRHTAGNFYINDKPSGAVVGHQPFGGSRASGTNDKAGSYLNLIRWTAARTIKETFVPATDYRYPYMG